jgi:hypothetical protein
MRRGAGAATRCASASFHRIGLVGAVRECCGAVSLACTVLSGLRPAPPAGWHSNWSALGLRARRRLRPGLTSNNDSLHLP